jgi:hypothetical protein
MSLATTLAPPVAPPRFAVVSTEPEPETTSGSAPPREDGLPHLRSRAWNPLTARHVPVVPGSVRAGAREAAARRRAETVVRIALEVLAGHRPLTHLAPFADPSVLRYVGAGFPGRGGVLCSLRCSPVDRTGTEVTAVCRFGGRHRALAARLDLTPTGDWRCTALRVL